MKYYLQDLISRLAQFSEQLDNTALFIDKPWVLIDADANYQKYIFKRDGELIMSLNGTVQVGKWEYLAAARSILVDRIADKILLNQSFFDRAVMVLKRDGSTHDLFILANETIIPDLDVKKYLQAVTYEKFNIITGRLDNGKVLECYRGEGEYQPSIGMKVTIDGEEPENGKYRSLNTGRYYEIAAGKIFRITEPVTYQTAEGIQLTIEQKPGYPIAVGDFVFVHDQPAATGKYRLGALKSIHVVNGVVNKTSIF
ncbi:MAG: hypothetical protein ACK56A_08085 [Bacteroidota bacterium]|jgi:hypothetical protein